MTNTTFAAPVERRCAPGDGVAYATKAFLCRAMARLAHEEGMHLDVASGGELHVALSAGVPPERLVLHGNNKSEEELAMAIECGVGRIVVDSFDEISRLGRLLDRVAAPVDRPKVLVRVTPGVEAHTHEFVRTGQEDSKFGFSVASGAAAEAVAALELMASVELVGVHADIGSQVFDASSFEQAAEVLGAFFAPLDLPELVVGGGLGVPTSTASRLPPSMNGRMRREPHARGLVSTPPPASARSPDGASWRRPASRFIASAPSRRCRESARM